MIDILCTSKPCDGLLYYSYEQCSYLNSLGIDATLIIITYEGFSEQDYLNSINDKYIHCINVEFEYFPEVDDVTIIMGRSMMTIPYLNIKSYSEDQKLSLRLLFNNKVISVYSENHPIQYHHAIEYFKAFNVIDLCDFDIYPNGVGTQFIKTINFSIHKEPIKDVKFKHLFLGTNESYYNTIQECIDDYPSHGILTYPQDYLRDDLNNIQAPVKNLLGIFDIYVYTKNTFDPAPRITQECVYFNKEIIYKATKDFVDGEKVYRDRGSIDISKTNEPILKAIYD